MISWCSWKLFSVFAFGVIFTLLTVTLLKLFDQLNGSSPAGSLFSSSSPLQIFNKNLKNRVLEVSPLDVENNTAPFLRQGPTLDSLLGYRDSSSALSSSMAQLNDISSGGLDLSSLNMGSSGLTDASMQSVNQLFGGQTSFESSAQGFGGGAFATNTNNDQMLNLLQSAIGGQSVTSPLLPSVYGSPSQYQSVVSTGSDQLLNSLQSVISPQLSNDISVSNMGNYASLLAGSGGSLVSQQFPSVTDQTSILGSLQPTPELPIDSKFSPLPNLNLDDSFLSDLNNSPTIDSLQSLISQQSGSSLASSASATALWPPLPFPNTQNPVTQLIFENQVPNLHVYACKLAFQSLVYKAYRDYLKLAAFPSCHNQQSIMYPSVHVPFKIIVVKEKVERPSLNPILLKFLWLLLQRQQRPVSPPIIVPPPFIVQPPAPAPPAIPLEYLITILNHLNTPKYRPNNQYLINLILNIIKRRLPDPVPVPLPLPGPDPLPFPLPFPDISIMDNESKFVMLIFQKYFPQRRFTSAEILFLVRLIHLLPRTINELLLNTQLLRTILYELTVRNLNPRLALAIIYSHLIHFNSFNSRAVELVYKVKKHPAIVYQPYYYVKYLVPYNTFVQKLYRLLLYKPQLINNRDLLFKELLVFALSNSGLSAELNGVPKEHLVQLVTNTGTVVPLDVKVTTSTVLNEQLKVLNDLNSLSFNSGLLDSSSLSSFWASLASQNSNFGSSSGSGLLSALLSQNLGGIDSSSASLLLSALLSKNSGLIGNSGLINANPINPGVNAWPLIGNSGLINANPINSGVNAWPLIGNSGLINANPINSGVNAWPLIGNSGLINANPINPGVNAWPLIGNSGLINANPINSGVNAWPLIGNSGLINANPINSGVNAWPLLLNQNTGNFDTAAPNIWSSFMNQNSGGGQSVIGSGIGSVGSSFGAQSGQSGVISEAQSNLGSSLGLGLTSAGSGLDTGYGSGIGSGVGSGLESVLGSGFDSGLGSSLGSGLGSSLGSDLGSSLGSGLGSAPVDATK